MGFDDGKRMLVSAMMEWQNEQMRGSMRKVFLSISLHDAETFPANALFILSRRYTMGKSFPESLFERKP